MQAMDQSQTTVTENPEITDLDAIITKAKDMMKSGRVDLEEIVMDLEDLKMTLSGEGEADISEPSEPSNMSGMINKMQVGQGGE